MNVKSIIKFWLLCLLISNALSVQADGNYYSLTLSSKGTTFYRGTLNTYDGTGGDWILTKPWKYSKGDNLEWAKPGYDDSGWDSIANTEFNVSKMKPGSFKGAGWFRIKLFVDSAFRNLPLEFMFGPTGDYSNGACEVYIDGNLSFGIGKFGTSEKDEKTEPMLPHSIAFNSNPYHVIAIRYSNFQRLSHYTKNTTVDGSLGFQCELMKEAPYQEAVVTHDRDKELYIILSIFYFTITFIHLMLFFFYRELRANLFYSLFTLCIGALFFMDYCVNFPLPFKTLHTIQSGFYYLWILAGLFLLAFYYSVLYQKLPKLFWIALFIAVLIISYIAFSTPTSMNFVFYIIAIGMFLLFVLIETIRIVIGAIFEKRDGAWILATGVGFIFLCAVFLIIDASIVRGPLSFTTGIVTTTILLYFVTCIPISMSIYLARTFARTNKNLTLQLVQVKKLSQENLQLIEGQKEKLEIQVKEKTAEISIQKDEIERKKNALEQKNKEVTDSINYAKRIQTAILPKKSELKNTLPNSFVLFKPKDIVSGDFYFFSQNDGNIFLAAADCTGHGVPGAFMSMIGTGKLSDAVQKSDTPGEVLKLLNQGIKISLHQTLDVESTRDGMDIALCSISKDTSGVRFTYSGANRPLWIIRKGSKEIEEIKATKKAIGGFTEEEQHFETHHIELNEGDTFYLFSDGYADQFGGDKGKKLTTKTFKDTLLSLQDKAMQEQEHELEAFIEKWKGTEEQLDDILVIGVRI